MSATRPKIPAGPKALPYDVVEAVTALQSALIAKASTFRLYAEACRTKRDAEKMEAAYGRAVAELAAARSALDGALLGDA
jgi:hypothetical protein